MNGIEDYFHVSLHQPIAELAPLFNNMREEALEIPFSLQNRIERNYCDDSRGIISLHEVDLDSFSGLFLICSHHGRAIRTFKVTVQFVLVRRAEISTDDRH